MERAARPEPWVRTAAALLLVEPAAKAIGFVRDAAIARRFGTSSDADALILLFSVWVGSALLLAAAWPKAALGEASARAADAPDAIARSAGAALRRSLLPTAALGLLVQLGADPLVHAFLPAGDPAFLEQTASLLRIVAPAPVFLSAAGALSILAHAHHRSVPVRLALALPAAGAAVALLLERSPAAAAWGALLGSVAAPLVLLVGLPGARAALRSVLAQPTGRSFLPAVAAIAFLGHGGGALFATVQHGLWASLAEGDVARLGYALRLGTLPSQVLGAAVLVVALPRIAAARRDPDPALAGRAAADAVRLFVFGALPATAMMVALHRPALTALFGRGAFDALALNGTASVLLALMPALLARGLGWAAATVLYAHERPNLAVGVGLGATTAFVAAGIAARPLGAFGLAAVQALVDGAAAVWLLRAAQARASTVPLLPLDFVLRMGLVAAAAGLAAYAPLAWDNGEVSSPARAMLQCGAGGALGVGALLVAGRLLRLPEASAALLRPARGGNR